MTSIDASLKPVGDVFRPLEGVVDLRSFDARYVRSFFPANALDSLNSYDFWFEYAETQGDPALRALIAGRLGLSAEQVLITDGASQALYLSILTVLGRGDTLFVPKPVFPAYTRMAAWRDCVVEYYACDRQGADLRQKLIDFPEGRRAGVIVNSPHNPTGTVLDTAALAEIVANAARKGFTTLLDDTYHWLAGDIDQFTQLPLIAPDAALSEATIAIASLGKFLCLPGLRLGFLATGNTRLIERMTEAKRHLSHASCPASEQQALRLLTSNEWRRGRAELASTLRSRRRTFERLATQHGVAVQAPALGFYTYAGEIEALTERKIVGITGEIFNAGSNEARYCLAASDADWRRVVESLSPRDGT